MPKNDNVTTERRQHDRLETPQLYIRFQDKVYRTVEWSFGGFVIETTSPMIAVGALVSVDGILDEPAYKRALSPEPVDIRARVVRVMPEDGLAALTCLHLDDAAYLALAAVRGGVSLREAVQA